MRSLHSLLMIWLLFVPLATASADATRAQILHDGKGSWTVDDGGPLGPIEVTMVRKGATWDVTVHGMFPIMNLQGQVYGVASKMFFWLSNMQGNTLVNTEGTLQTRKGRWEPGQAFDATFSIAATMFDNRPNVGLHVAVGDDAMSIPSTRLAPRP